MGIERDAPLRRLAFIIEYEGTAYRGSQWQKQLPTIQGELERAIREMLGQPARVALATVLAARGYPEQPELGAAIMVPRDLEPGTLVFHAGTDRDPDGTLRVHGGRVLTVTALGDTLAEAAKRCAAACERIAFEGKTYRRDIGWRELRLGRAGAARG